MNKLAVMMGVWAIGQTAWASCDSITDPDQRYLCRAKVERKTYLCSSIVDGDLRNYCRAITEPSITWCNSVNDGDLRNTCKAEAGAIVQRSRGSESVSSHNCSSISNSDDRYMCRAVVEKNVSLCSSIRDSDRKYYCRALVEKSTSYCSSISDSNLKAQCKSEAND